MDCVNKCCQTNDKLVYKTLMNMVLSYWKTRIWYSRCPQCSLQLVRFRIPRALGSNLTYLQSSQIPEIFIVVLEEQAPCICGKNKPLFSFLKKDWGELSFWPPKSPELILIWRSFLGTALLFSSMWLLLCLVHLLFSILYLLLVVHK